MGTILTWPLASENSAVLQLTSLHEGPYSDRLPLMLGLPGTTHVQASTLRIQSYGSKSPFSPLFRIQYLGRGCVKDIYRSSVTNLIL